MGVTNGTVAKELSMSIYWKRLVVGLTFTLIICVFGFIIGYTEENGGVVYWSSGVRKYWGNVITA